MSISEPNTKPDLVEALAAIEHDQWMHWSKAVALDVSVPTREKWQRSWTAYADLPNDLKELDRIWARKVVELLHQRGFIP